MSRPIYPLNAPGLATPGQSLFLAAQALGDAVDTRRHGSRTTLVGGGVVLEDLVRRCLYDRNVVLSLPIKGRAPVPMRLVPGHVWGVADDGQYGPRRCDVAVIGKMLGEDEANRRRQFIGKSGECLLSTLRKLGITGMRSWYVTNLLKCEHPRGERGGSITTYIKEFQHLLDQELRLVRPKFVLCLAADALKAVMGHKQWTLSRADGRVLEREIDIRTSHDQPPRMHKMYVMGCIHPAAVLSEPRNTPLFEKTLTRFNQLVQGIRWDAGEPDVDYRVAHTEDDLRQCLRTADKELAPDRIVGVDAEWHGQHPQNKGSYVRCVQFSWREKKAVVVPLRAAGGKPLWPRVRLHPGSDQMVLLPIKLLYHWFQDKRVAGIFFNSDLEWLIPEGLDLRPQFAASRRWQDCLVEGGLEIAAMAHAVNETDDFEMNAQLRTYTSMPRYDVELENWKKQEAARRGVGVSQLEGYGDVPDDILYPYGARDADGNYRLARVHLQRLTRDEFGNDCRRSFWNKQKALPAALEMTMTGLRVNHRRLDELTSVFMQARDEIREKIREEFRWPDLNMESHSQIRELLFGEQYSGEGRGRQRPPGAKSLYCMPAITTGKRPKAWQEVLEKGQEAEFTPSTDKTSLGILYREADQMLVKRHGRWVHKDFGAQIGRIRDYRLINQALKYVLRPPIWDASTQSFAEDEEGNWLYESGLASTICDDNRVRTSLSLYMETGRWSSSRPPLQNISKRRDAEYSRILGERYNRKIRSIFETDPGHLLLEADYSGAELYGAGILSGDIKLLEHARRGLLPEWHPDYYDIHSNIAVLAFHLSCAPTKAGLKAIGKSHLRIVAKATIFGTFYGRGAKAIALSVREEGVQITVDEAQAVIDAIFTEYPGLVPFFAECRERAAGGDDNVMEFPRWLASDLGGFRRFPVIKDRKQKGDAEREAMNWPIQHLVAAAVNKAVANLGEYRRRHRLKFKMVLQIHDALLFLVPYQEVHQMVHEVLPECMTRQVPIYQCNLDGVRMPNAEAHHLGFDHDLHFFWGEQLYPDDLLPLNVDPALAHWRFVETLGGYVHRETPDKVWRQGTIYKKSDLEQQHGCQLAS